MKIPKQAYTLEFKELAVKRVKDGQSLAGGQRTLGWSNRRVKAAAAGKFNGAVGKEVTPEEMELSRRRAENQRLNGSWKS